MLNSSFAKANRPAVNDGKPRKALASAFQPTSSSEHFKSAFVSRGCDTFNADDDCGNPNSGSGRFR